MKDQNPRFSISGWCWHVFESMICHGVVKSSKWAAGDTRKEGDRRSMAAFRSYWGEFEESIWQENRDDRWNLEGKARQWEGVERRSKIQGGRVVDDKTEDRKSVV